ncbi:hypothetical protein B0F90DRAFT_869577 [Multifurca ochricompacta]|uniref:Uncharacterized protein n=1 Tax=Multifurca ochricompacta TaxID=376703 RepID=A0AAD4M0X2_9AGAM|nr:hypothetical protein B0F90DRAFT_869577 [Multifurca ochricompacta]
MTEYTTDPEAIAHYLAARARTANWVDSLSGKTLVAPFVPPSLVSDTDDGLSSQDSDGESSHSLPPRMVLRYPDGRPDVPVSGIKPWSPQSQKHASPPYHSRPRAGSHGYPPSNPNIHSRAPSHTTPLYITPPPPVIATQPETIHVRPSPTGLGPQLSPNSYLTPETHNSSSMPPTSRSRSMRSTPSSRPPPVSLQMIYSPPPPSSQSHSAPVSPTYESFQPAQQPPPVPQPPVPQPPIVSPSPIYGFPSPASPHEPPPVGPPTHSRTQSRTLSYSSNHSHPHPQAIQPSGAPGSYPSSSAQRPRHHSSRAGTSHPDAPQPSHAGSQTGSHIGGSSFNSASGSRRHGPPSIVYAPSAHSSSYIYNPPVITSRLPPPPPTMTHAPAPHHAHRMAQSISDPTPVGGSLGRNSSRGRLFEHFPRTPSPNTARVNAKESSRKDKSRRKEGGGRGGDDDDDIASFSSGSTYYVIPSPGQKIKVVVSPSISN